MPLGFCMKGSGFPTKHPAQFNRDFHHPTPLPTLSFFIFFNNKTKEKERGGERGGMMSVFYF
jgi:hypothetical protein